MSRDVQHVFLVGAKSLGAYGGFETFINKLTEYHQDNQHIQYHVACKANGIGSMDESQLDSVSNVILRKDNSVAEFTYHNARCFKIPVPNIGAAQAIYYDIVALLKCCKYIEKHHIAHPIIYIMACRIGPFMPYFYARIRKLGGHVYVNPDGHEWMRLKWGPVIRKYWRFSEELAIRYCDLVVCDSVSIEKYIHLLYDGKGTNGANPKTTYIAYGAETESDGPNNTNPALLDWYKRFGLTAGNYYLIVGRFVPENNFETMIREFLASTSSKSLAIITDVNDKFLNTLEEKLHFSHDPRIKFTGTVYDQELLAQIRKNAYGYIHGHEVGGTNPSLLESLGMTKLNLLLDVEFNREAADSAGLYWTKQDGSLAALIEHCDRLKTEEAVLYGNRAKERIANHYSWLYIAKQYEKLFCKEQYAKKKDSEYAYQ